MTEKVDPAWAERVLTGWVDRCDAALASPYGGERERFCDAGPQTDALLEREMQTRRVIQLVLGMSQLPPPLVRDIGGYNDVELQAGADLARRALGHLRTAEETARHVAGTAAPTMPADELHSLVWNAAASLWDDGHYGHAVQRAATFLNAHIQDLTGRRDVSESTLMAQTFSLQPPEAGKPRLRWPGDGTDLTVKAMRSGLLNFSQGCYLAIRNPLTHGTAEVGRQQALEQLAVLSTLARWVDECELIEAAPTSE